MTNIPYPAQEPAAQVSTLQRSMDILVSGLIGVYDLSADTAVQTQIAQILARVGVERIEVLPGTEFDPSRFEAVSTVVSTDPADRRRVAQTLRPGWQSTGAVLRSPQVSVWVLDPPASQSAGGFDPNGGR